MSTTYTAEDFANATIAIRGSGDIARRIDPGDSIPWRTWDEKHVDAEWESDDGMAAAGWRPVREHDEDDCASEADQRGAGQATHTHHRREGLMTAKVAIITDDGAVRVFYAADISVTEDAVRFIGTFQVAGGSLVFHVYTEEGQR